MAKSNCSRNILRCRSWVSCKSNEPTKSNRINWDSAPHVLHLDTNRHRRTWPSWSFVTIFLTELACDINDFKVCFSQQVTAHRAHYAVQIKQDLVGGRCRWARSVWPHFCKHQSYQWKDTDQPRIEESVDENGIRTTIEYSLNDEGKKVKVSTAVQKHNLCSQSISRLPVA